MLNAKLYDTKTAVQVNQHHIKATSITLLDQQMDAFCRELLFGQYSSTSNLKDEKLKFEKVEKFESEIVEILFAYKFNSFKLDMSLNESSSMLAISF